MTFRARPYSFSSGWIHAMPQSPRKRSLTFCVACAAAVLSPSLPGAPTIAAQDAPARGAFILRVRNDTILIERFARIGDILQGSMSAKGAPKVDYVMTLGPANTVQSLSLTVFAANATADDKPVQQARLTMKGDSAIAEVGGNTQRLGSKAGAIPYVNGSVAMMELFTRRARAAGGTATTPLLAVSGGATIPVAMRPLGPDSLLVTVATQEQRLRVDAAGSILGGVSPAQQLEIIRVSGPAAAALTLGRGDYSAPVGAPYRAEEVTLRGPGGIALGGTLTIPANAGGPVPAIVTITGSGQQDRDEYIPVAGGYRPFRQLADTLGRRGIAVLRLDDRMIGLSGGTIGTSAEYADDIRAALAYLRTRPEVDGKRLALVGHSEGGIIAPIVAATDQALRGIVTLAGPAYSGSTIIRYQLRNALNHDASIAPDRKDSAYRAMQAVFDSTSRRSVWTQYFLTYDPVPTAKKVKVPALILQGRTDQQVTFEQAELLGAAMRSGGNRDVTVRVFPDMNHLFIYDPDGNPAGYAKLPTNKMSAEVLGAIADWLAAKLSLKNSM